jgi:hypothetical protein
MAGRKQKAQPSDKGTEPPKSNSPEADVIIEAEAERIADEAPAENRDDVKADTAAPPKHQRPGLAVMLSGVALLLGLIGVGLAGYSFQQINHLNVQQDELLARMERLDQRVAEIADAALLQQQEEELNSFGRRLDDITADFGRMIEQINTMSETIASRLAEPGREILDALERRLDEIDQSLSSLTLESESTDQTESDLSQTNQADGANGDKTSPSRQSSVSTPSPAAPEEKSADKETNSSGETGSSWIDWIKDFIRIERINEGE